MDTFPVQKLHCSFKLDSSIWCATMVILNTSALKLSYTLSKSFQYLSNLCLKVLRERKCDHFWKSIEYLPSCSIQDLNYTHVVLSTYLDLSSFSLNEWVHDCVFCTLYNSTCCLFQCCLYNDASTIIAHVTLRWWASWSLATCIC